MRRCRTKADSFTLLKRRSSQIQRSLPSISNKTRPESKLLGIETVGSKKSESICTIDGHPVCCKDPVCSCKEKVLLEQLRSRASPLFCTVTQQGLPELQKSPFTPEMLISGFGLRNLSSIQRLLLKQRIADRDSDIGEYSEAPTIVTGELSESSQTEITLTTTTSTEEILKKKRSLEYLMGIRQAEVEEEAVEEEALRYIAYEERAEEEKYTGLSIAMRQAQRYLRVHKIFEFFQFLIAHMLSALPDNPIEFLMELLERCLIYRAGMGEAPLLYKRKHLGLKTVGVCSFELHPPTTKDGLINKDFFVEEGYSRLTDQLNDMLRRRYLRFPRPSLSQPPPTPQPSGWSQPSFIPIVGEEEENVEEHEEKVQEDELMRQCRLEREMQQAEQKAEDA